MSFVEQLNQLFTVASRQQRFSGAVLLNRNEETIFSQAYGYANRSWRIKNRVDTRFRIASISKMFTAVAILQLVERGAISLQTSVVDCLGLQETAIPQQATVYHMLTMTSGIADWFEESGDWAEEWAALCRQHPIYRFRQNADYLPLFVNKASRNPVGEKHRYSNAGYILLGLIIERVSGLSYFDYIRQHVFQPAHMSRSDFIALDAVDSEVAEGYLPVTDEDETIIGWRKNIFSTTPEAAADGGATSTLLDLVSFSQALRHGQLLSDEMTQEMLSPKVLETDEPFRGYVWKYGYGNHFILDEDEQIVRWGHTGEEDGVSCRLYHYPQKNLDVVILANRSWCAGDLAWQVHDLIHETGPMIDGPTAGGGL